MAQTRITELAAYSDPKNTDVLPVVDITSDVTKKVDIAAVNKNAALGTDALCGMAFDGDPNTGIFSPGADTLAIATNGVERLRVDTNGFMPHIGSIGRGTPVTKTTNFTVGVTENWIICTGTASITATLPTASAWTGREIMIKTTAAFTVVSASSNVVPLVGGSAGTAILAATAGKYATLVSNGTSWIIMQAN